MPTFGFAFLLVLTFAAVLRIWLGVRNISHVQAHRNAVPAQFSGDVSLDAHQRAADYTAAKTRLALLSIVIDTALVVWLTFGGGVQRMYEAASGWFDGEIARGLALIALVSIVTTLVELPLGLYRTFRIEERFGFNKMTAALYWIDFAKNAALAAALGLPLAACVLWLMQAAG
ncbi:MAG: M48 family peptidase, partial [Burkholderiales bacterium]